MLSRKDFFSSVTRIGDSHITTRRLINVSNVNLLCLFIESFKKNIFFKLLLARFYKTLKIVFVKNSL